MPSPSSVATSDCFSPSHTRRFPANANLTARFNEGCVSFPSPRHIHHLFLFSHARQAPPPVPYTPGLPLSFFLSNRGRLFHHFCVRDSVRLTPPPSLRFKRTVRNGVVWRVMGGTHRIISSIFSFYLKKILGRTVFFVPMMCGCAIMTIQN